MIYFEQCRFRAFSSDIDSIQPYTLSAYSRNDEPCSGFVFTGVILDSFGSFCVLQVVEDLPSRTYSKSMFNSIAIAPLYSARLSSFEPFCHLTHLLFRIKLKWRPAHRGPKYITKYYLLSRPATYCLGAHSTTHAARFLRILVLQANPSNSKQV